MTFMESISACFGKYITFKGRAQRSEFWWFVLFLIIVNAVLGQVDSMVFGPTLMISDMGMEFNAGFFGGAFALATFLPSWAVQVRRLHDIGKSGWWLLLALIPLIGAIILLIWLAKAGTDGDNEYGSNPLA